MVGNVALERCAQFLFSGFESARAQLTQLVRVAFSPMIARRIARPLTPKIVLITLVNLMFASSNVF